MPTAPPNSGPNERDIMKYDPPAGTIPFVAIAAIDIAVRSVWKSNRNLFFFIDKDKDKLFNVRMNYKEGQL